MSAWSSWASHESHLYTRGELYVLVVLPSDSPWGWEEYRDGRREILLPMHFFLKEWLLFSWHSLACEYIWIKLRGQETRTSPFRPIQDFWGGSGEEVTKGNEPHNSCQTWKSYFLCSFQIRGLVGRSEWGQAFSQSNYHACMLASVTPRNSSTRRAKSKWARTRSTGLRLLVTRTPLSGPQHGAPVSTQVVAAPETCQL